MKNFMLFVILMVSVLSACGAPATPAPEAILPLASTNMPFLTPDQTTTISPVPPTEAPISTPSPVPANTPIVTPTPQGGKSGLLLMNDKCQSDTTSDTLFCKVYTYDIRSHKISLLLEGYSPIGVSPDGKKIAVERTDDNQKTDLFVVDLAKPDQMVLLSENVRTYKSRWFPGTDWIGFIAPKDGTPQVFIVHPDSSNLTQVTNSPTGAVSLESVFNDGVFWGEGTGNQISVYKWTKLDGTEKIFTNFVAVSPRGKFLLTSSLDQSSDCFGCTYDLMDLATDETSKISLSRPSPDIELGFVGIQPLSDDLWLVKRPGDLTVEEKYWIYSKDGHPLLDFATLPHEHDPLPDNSGQLDYYRIAGGDGGDLSNQRLSPDGTWLLIQHWIRDNDYKNVEIDYYLLNLSTFKIQKLPEFSFMRKDGTEEGIYSRGFLWIELP